MTDVVQQGGFKRVWFITGVCRGIGAWIAEAAPADGRTVVGAGRNGPAIVGRLGESVALEESADKDIRRIYDTNIFSFLIVRPFLQRFGAGSPTLGSS